MSGGAILAFGLVFCIPPLPDFIVKPFRRPADSLKLKHDVKLGLKCVGQASLDTGNPIIEGGLHLLG
jgi:hypothetical protein